MKPPCVAITAPTRIACTEPDRQAGLPSSFCVVVRAMFTPHCFCPVVRWFATGIRRVGLRRTASHRIRLRPTRLPDHALGTTEGLPIQPRPEDRRSNTTLTNSPITVRLRTQDFSPGTTDSEPSTRHFMTPDSFSNGRIIVCRCRVRCVPITLLPFICNMCYTKMVRLQITKLGRTVQLVVGLSRRAVRYRSVAQLTYGGHTVVR